MDLNEVIKSDRVIKRAKDKNLLSVFFIIYAILVIVANTVLAMFFRFPDILRESSGVRFDLFIQNSHIIIPAYYAFLATAFLQIFVAILIYHFINKKDSLSSMTLCSGILAGLFQVLGFARWIIAVPYLALQGADVSVLEGFGNAYLGMTIGEHLGTLFLGIWLVLVAYAMLRSKMFDKVLSSIALASGLGFIISSFEPFGLSSLGILSLPIWALFILWMMLSAYNLFRTKNEAPKIPWYIWVIAVLFYLVNVVPAFM